MSLAGKLAAALRNLRRAEYLSPEFEWDTVPYRDPDKAAEYLNQQLSAELELEEVIRNIVRDEIHRRDSACRNQRGIDSQITNHRGNQ